MLADCRGRPPLRQSAGLRSSKTSRRSRLLTALPGRAGARVLAAVVAAANETDAASAGRQPRGTFDQRLVNVQWEKDLATRRISAVGSQEKPPQKVLVAESRMREPMPKRTESDGEIPSPSRTHAL